MVEESCQDVEVEGRRARGEEGRREGKEESRGEGKEEGRGEGNEESRVEGKEEGKGENARREEASLKSIDVIATKLVTSAEQERRSSQETKEAGRRREEQPEGSRREEQEEGDKGKYEDKKQNVFACSAEMMRTLQESVAEAPLLSPCIGGTGGRKEV